MNRATWPPDSVERVQVGPIGNGDLILDVAPTGSFGVVLRRPAGEQLMFESQPVAFVDRAAMVISISLDATEVRMYVNGRELLPLSASPEALQLEAGDSPQFDDPPALVHDQAGVVCADAMARRRRWLADPTRIKESYKTAARPLTDDEQRQQLVEAIRSLRALSAAVQSGQTEFVGPLASQLRALLYLQPGNRAYNPLILRLAARAESPLPVFAIPADNGAPSVDDQPTMHVTPYPPAIVRTLPSQQLMDLQDWMDVPVRVERTTASDSAIREAAVLTAGTLIWEAATKFGAHYDEWIPLRLDHLQELGVERNALARLLAGVGHTTCALGDWLVGKP